MFNYVLCIFLFVYLLILYLYFLLFYFISTYVFVLLCLSFMFSDFQEQKTKLSELYLANGSSESKSSAAQRIVGFLNSLTNFLNPDANFVPQERVKALKVLRTLCFYAHEFHRQICLC